jgi:hypothetical protein
MHKHAAVTASSPAPPPGGTGHRAHHDPRAYCFGVADACERRRNIVRREVFPLWRIVAYLSLPGAVQGRCGARLRHFRPQGGVPQ